MARSRPKWMQEPDASSSGQERRVAGLIGGAVTPASGATAFAKGDVKAVGWLAECKRTDARSLRIESSWLNKISREAMLTNCKPMLTIEIGGNDDPIGGGDWILLPVAIFQQLQRAAGVDNRDGPDR